MRIPESCVECLYRKQERMTADAGYLKEIRNLLDHRNEDDCAPYMVYLFNQVYERYFGAKPSFREINRKYNDFVLAMESELRQKIENSEHPLETALLYARNGNYIDFAAMAEVDDQTFLSLFDQTVLSDADRKVMDSLWKQCEAAHSFLLLADNCGEIVLDKLLLEQLKKKWPEMTLRVMVRGSEIQNDAAMEDAVYVGLDRVAEIISNGKPIAGTVYDLLPEESRRIFDESDVILSKGQGNYEALNGKGKHAFYAFLCKCELFTGRFGVPKLTGLLIEE